jgi:hypothetical protein
LPHGDADAAPFEIAADDDLLDVLVTMRAGYLLSPRAISGDALLNGSVTMDWRLLAWVEFV